MRLRASVRHALRHRVRLVPDDVLPQIPAVLLKREGNAPGNANQVFGLQPGLHFHRIHRGSVGFFHGNLPLLRRIPDTLSAARVTVPQVQPQRPVVTQHPSHFAEHTYQFVHIRIGSFLQPDLPLHPIIAKSEVGRACDTGVDASWRKHAQRRKTVAFHHFVVHTIFTPL